MADADQAARKPVQPGLVRAIIGWASWQPWPRWLQRGGEVRVAPAGARPAGNPRRRVKVRFWCTICGWTGLRGPNLIYCPKCDEASVVRENPYGGP